MIKKETRDDLVAKVAKLSAEIESVNDKEIKKRKEFAKAFEMYGPASPYNTERDLQLPSWSQIFVKIGRLLEVESSFNISGRMEDLRLKVDGVEHHLIELSDRQGKHEKESKE